MPKQVLKVDNFKGGVNSLSDARDIEDNQFVQNWNAVTDKDGVIRVAGGGEVQGGRAVSARVDQIRGLLRRAG